MSWGRLGGVPTPPSTQLVHLIRHAHAGSRSHWHGDDAARPLSERGAGQARILTEQLADAGIDLVWSSRFVRCRETVEPLASKLGLEVVDHADLSEGGSGGAALDALLAAAADGRTVAACSHGDVIPALVATALGRGATLDGPPSPAKGARYVLTVADGRPTHLQHVSAPDGTT